MITMGAQIHQIVKIASECLTKKLDFIPQEENNRRLLNQKMITCI